MASRLGPIRLWFMASALIICSTAPASCSNHTYNGPVQTINFGDLSTDSSLFLYIAQQQDFFTKNGIDLVVKNYATGPLAVQALNKGEVDLTSTGEYPVVGQVMSGIDMQVLCSMDEYHAFYVVARTDLGVSSVADLKGKKVGLVQKALPEFYFGRFLTVNNVDPASVTVLNVAPADWVSSITSGAVDALVVNQASLVGVETQLAGRYIAWDVQNYQQAYGLVYCSAAWLDQNKAAAGRFLKALSQAEDYFNRHKDESRALLKSKFNYSDEYLAALWPEHAYGLSLSQSLVAAMEDEARWMAANGLSAQTAIPDFMKNMYREGLANLKPDAVNLG